MGERGAKDLRQDALFPQDKELLRSGHTSITMQMFQETCGKENKPSLFILNKLRKHKPDL